MMLVSGGEGASASLLVPVVVALLTAAGAVVTVFLNARANLRLEREKFKTNAKLEREKFDATEKLEAQKFEANEKLERQKFESSLVLHAIATDNQRRARKNLEFLVDVGFLADPKGRIKALREKPENTPVLPGRSTSKGWWSAPMRPGKHRWGVKTGSDPDAALVETTPVKTTVEKLAKEARPADMLPGTDVFPAYQNRRAEGVERTVYLVEAEIISCRLETSGNFHLTLQGKTGQTMIANCPNPDPEFVDPSSRWAKEIAVARGQIHELLRPEPSMKRAKQRVRLTGVGFFNRLHGQLGMAPNGVELTPVLSIEWLPQS